MEYDVQQINQVHEVVQAEPDEQCVLVDFSKTEMVTPETSLNMSNSAFLASLGLEQLR